MQSSWKYAPIFLVVAYFAACAPVKFSATPEPPCGANGVSCVQKCTGTACIKSYSTEQMIAQPMVDILVVDDNSGSMSPHQSKMATAFAGFINQLDTASLDYRIAITTTDISNKYSTSGTNSTNGPSAFNGQGALQDGNLISFSNGRSYISQTDSNRDSLFISQVQRQETIHCEQSGFRECPSNDERGIYAANLVLERTASQFVRPTSHFAVIILANEDERGISDPRAIKNNDPNDAALVQMYQLETNDKPETFISKFKSLFPAKTVSVHSIIVKPGDSACLTAETDVARNLRGREGFSYASLSQSTGGVVASICDSNYTTNLKAISDNIQAQAISMPFQCRPIGDQYSVTFSPQPAIAPTATPDWSKLQLNISKLPPGTKVSLSYDCSSK